MGAQKALNKYSTYIVRSLIVRAQTHAEYNEYSIFNFNSISTQFQFNFNSMKFNFNSMKIRFQFNENSFNAQSILGGVSGDPPKLLPPFSQQNGENLRNLAGSLGEVSQVLAGSSSSSNGNVTDSVTQGVSGNNFSFQCCRTSSVHLVRKLKYRICEP